MKCRGLTPATWGCLINGMSLLRQTRSTQIRDDYYGVASLSILLPLTLKSCSSVVKREKLINAHLLIIYFLYLLIFCCVNESWTALVSPVGQFLSNSLENTCINAQVSLCGGQSVTLVGRSVRIMLLWCVFSIALSSTNTHKIVLNIKQKE